MPKLKRRSKYFVKIPKKYKENLMDRFNTKNIKDGIINIKCKLCLDFKTICKECPFKNIKTLKVHNSKCVIWIKKILKLKISIQFQGLILVE